MKRYDACQMYTVYDNRTDLPVIVSGSASECASAMGVVKGTFYSYLTPSGKARRNRWTVVKSGLGGEFSEPKTIGQYMRMCRLKKGMRLTTLRKSRALE